MLGATRRPRRGALSSESAAMPHLPAPRSAFAPRRARPLRPRGRAVPRLRRSLRALSSRAVRPPTVPAPRSHPDRWPALLTNPWALTAVVVTASLVLFCALAAAQGVLHPETLWIVVVVAAVVTTPAAIAVQRYHDRTERQTRRLADLASELRYQAEVYERGAAERAQTVGTIAHELKNPLGNVREYAKTIQSAADDAALVREFAGLMEQEATEVLGTVTDLLNSLAESRLDVTLKRERLSLGALAEQVVRANRPRAEAKRQAITFFAEPNLDVEADPHRLHVILSNLLSNAIKYTPEGGAIRLCVQSEWAPQGLEARVEVEDDGPGVGPDEAERVFTPFARGTAQPTGGEQQTGLGLAISRRLAERHGGRLWADPDARTGARFVLALPLV